MTAGWSGRLAFPRAAGPRSALIGWWSFRRRSEPEACMSEAALPQDEKAGPSDLGLLILRLAVGGLLAGHGAQKLFGWFGGHGLEGTGGWLESIGLRPGKSWALMAGLSEFG